MCEYLLRLVRLRNSVQRLGDIAKVGGGLDFNGFIDATTKVSEIIEELISDMPNKDGDFTVTRNLLDEILDRDENREELYRLLLIDFKPEIRKEFPSISIKNLEAEVRKRRANCISTYLVDKLESLE